MPPNNVFQLTAPAGALKIVRILLTVFPFYRCDGQGRQLNTGRWARLMRKIVSILNSALCHLCTRTLCSHKGTNRAWDEGSLCDVVPFKAFVTLRGTKARGAECGSGQRLTQRNVVRKLVMPRDSIQSCLNPA